jgi:predicted enzyme related to lactoylglutathione lyase
MRLRYLYVGSSDTGRDVAAWLALDGASLRWRFRHFGADVAAIAFDDDGTQPTVLLADHRPAASVLPIYAVDDAEVLADRLRLVGWQLVAGPLGTPEGPVMVLRDPSGTEMALLVVERPGTMEAAYGDAANEHAVRPDGARPGEPGARRDAPSPHTGST